MKKLINRNDLILIGVLIACVAVIFIALFLTREKGNSVVVNVDGQQVISFPLDKDAEYLINGYDGGTNLLVIEGGEAYLIDSSCPDHLCEYMGKISKVGQSIICLPNRVVVEIVGEKDAKGEYDTISS